MDQSTWLGATPTLADGKRAATAVADAGVGLVLLFGSVARGEAHPESDIDLMAVFDNIDYTKRHELSDRLGKLAAEKVGCRVDVHVTDRPEWKARTEQVNTSFERRVFRHALVVVDKPCGKVDWGKEMVMPTNDYDEAAERLHRVLVALGGLDASLVPTLSQQHWDAEGDEIRACNEYEARLARGCAAGHLIVETAIKALIHLSASPSAMAWGHDLTKLFWQLPEPHQGDIGERLASVGLEELQKWEERARYERYVTPTPEMFYAIAEAAFATALYTAEQFQPGLRIADAIEQTVALVGQVAAERDLYTGELI